MSNLKHRLAALTDKVAEAGMAGRDMNVLLSKLAEAEDLSGNEIRRIAEDANRRVQLGLYKIAADKRFKFKLADGPGIAKKASRQFVEERKTSSAQVMLDTIDEVGGDPYAAPYRDETANLSVFNAPVRLKIAEQSKQVEQAELIVRLKTAGSELEAIDNEAKIEEIRIKKAAVDAHDRMVQSAVNLVAHGVTLPSLYDASIAGASGSNSSVPLDEAKAQADQLMKMVIAGLKERGISNYQMGFRHNGDPDGLERLTADQLIALCQRQSSYQRKQDITQRDVKCAELLKEADSYFEQYSGLASSDPNADAPMRPDDALEMLRRRASLNGRYAVPQAYLDDAVNSPNDVPRVFNTNDEFVVSVQDLVGAQDRIRRCHGAQEYLGLKLKQIEETVRNLSDVKKTAELATTEEAEGLIGEVLEQKQAWVGALAGRTLGGLFGRRAAQAGAAQATKVVKPSLLRRAGGTATDIGTTALTAGPSLEHR
jgi:hypothetical protein